MKTRIISGIVGIVIFVSVLAVSFKVPLVLLFALALLNGIAIYEILYNTKLVTYMPFVLLSCLQGVGFVVSFMQKDLYQAVKFAALSYAAYFLITAIISVLFHKKTNTRGMLAMMLLPFMLSVAFTCMFLLFETSLSTLGFSFFTVFIFAWGADTGAYFTGTFIGKHKIAPEISPKKTLEGCLGGVASAVVLSCLLGVAYGPHWSQNYLRLCIFAVIFSVIGMFGDLFTSFIKRDCGIKDYGKIMPGHGGVLDRFDSVLFIAPFYFVAALIL